MFFEIILLVGVIYVLFGSMARPAMFDRFFSSPTLIRDLENGIYAGTVPSKWYKKLNRKFQAFYSFDGRERIEYVPDNKLVVHDICKFTGRPVLVILPQSPERLQLFRKAFEVRENTNKQIVTELRAEVDRVKDAWAKSQDPNAAYNGILTFSKLLKEIENKQPVDNTGLRVEAVTKKNNKEGNSDA